ncbi:MAG: serine/threonine-protein kinase [Myxococcota bacterium]
MVDWSSPSPIINHFSIRGTLGHNQYGAVYLAHDLKQNTDVALKVSRHSRRLRHEYDTLRALQGCAGAPEVFGFGEGDDGRGLAWMSMEHIPGASARGYIRASGRRERLGRIKEFLRGVLAALTHLHAAGFLHCDLKASNIIVTENGRVRLIDFGCARRMDAGRCSGARFAGTCTHAPPEQLVGGTLDARTDLFSFGVLAYDLLAERLPFMGTTPHQALREIVSQKPRPPEPAPPELASLVMSSIASCPEARPSSAADALQMMNGSQPRSLRQPR